MTQFTIVSPNQITVISPPGAAGTVDVTAVSSGGRSPAAPGDQYTYIPPPAVSSVTLNSGSYEGGDTVTIQGSNLGSVMPEVYFGSTVATILSDNGTQIKAISPGHAVGRVDVTVATTGGISPTWTGDSFNYEYVAPIVSGISPSSGATTGGTTVTITGDDLLGATEVDFGGARATSFTINGSGQIVATSPPGAADVRVDVTVVAWGLRSATSVADYFTYAAVSIVSGLSPSSGPAAGGTTVIISARTCWAPRRSILGARGRPVLRSTGPVRSRRSVQPPPPESWST